MAAWTSAPLSPWLGAFSCAPFLPRVPLGHLDQMGVLSLAVAADRPLPNAPGCGGEAPGRSAQASTAGSACLAWSPGSSALGRVGLGGAWPSLGWLGLRPRREEVTHPTPRPELIKAQKVFEEMNVDLQEELPSLWNR